MVLQRNGKLVIYSSGKINPVDPNSLALIKGKIGPIHNQDYLSNMMDQAHIEQLNPCQSCYPELVVDFGLLSRAQIKNPHKK